MLVAIEGIDGAGKGTQAKLLADRVCEAGLSVACFSFPRYGNNAFGNAVGWYLNGKFGGVDQVAPHLAALLYAGDRFAARDELVGSCATCDVVIADRYVPSNLAHQAAKLPELEREDFIVWLTTIEYEIYGIPRPDIVIYLTLPVAIAADLVLQKDERDYTLLAADIHEEDTTYLRRCKDVYDLLAAKNDDNVWSPVDCVSRGAIRCPREINDDIWTMLTSRLPASSLDI